MLPPEWVLEGGKRLDLSGFAGAFADAWSTVGTRFLKLECWQAYRELAANESQAAFDRGDVETAQALLRSEAEADRPLYEDVRRRGIEYARVRLVQEPLSRYLDYEMLSYRVRAEMGENIEVVRCEPARRLPDEESFDVLLFDRDTALIHDYGTGATGVQTGGWLTRDPEVVRFVEERIAALRRRAVPLRDFLAGR